MRHLMALAIAVGVTWWLLFRAPAPVMAGETPVGPVTLQPVFETAVDVRTPEPEMDDAPSVAEAEEPEQPIDVPPPEAGSRDGDEDGEAAEKVEEPVEDTAEVAAESSEAEAVDPTPTRTDAADLARNDRLLEAAADELAGRAAYGFSTAFIAPAEQQIDIARAFGENLVLVPHESIQPDAKDVTWYRLDVDGTPRVTEITSRPPVDQFRQYRDLFAYDYARLPRPLRTLRNSVPQRDMVFVFAALIPVEEWAIVVGRRQEALAALGVDRDDVERFVMRYVRLSDGRFDIVTDSVELVDGRTLVPPSTRPQSSARSGRASR